MSVSLSQFARPVNDSEFCWGLEASQSSPHTLPLAIRKSKPQWLTTSFLRKEAMQSYILNMLSGNTLQLPHSPPVRKTKIERDRSGLALWENFTVLCTYFLWPKNQGKYYFHMQGGPGHHAALSPGLKTSPVCGEHLEHRTHKILSEP